MSDKPVIPEPGTRDFFFQAADLLTDSGQHYMLICSFSGSDFSCRSSAMLRNRAAVEWYRQAANRYCDYLLETLEE